MSEKLKALGLCLGASTLSVVELEMGQSLKTNPTAETRPKVTGYSLYTHEGDPKQTLLDAFDRLDLNSFDRIAATGRKFRKFVNLSSIPEPEAVEQPGHDPEHGGVYDEQEEAERQDREGQGEQDRRRAYEGVHRSQQEGRTEQRPCAVDLHAGHELGGEPQTEGADQQSQEESGHGSGSYPSPRRRRRSIV